MLVAVVGSSSNKSASNGRTYSKLFAFKMRPEAKPGSFGREVREYTSTEDVAALVGVKVKDGGVHVFDVETDDEKYGQTIVTRIIGVKYVGELVNEKAFAGREKAA